MTLPKIKRKKASGQSTKLQVLLYLCAVSFCLFTALFLLSKSIESTAPINLAAGTSSIGGDNARGGKGDITTNSRVVDKKQELRGIRNSNGQPNASSLSSSSLPKTITLNTSEGDIKIKLRPDLSLPSVQYIKNLLDDPSPCKNCRFYRAEKPGILQGILAKEKVKRNTILGDCPEEFKGKKHDCPEHDPNCGCHGPVMKRGMIGWAAGGGGPDFFIDSYIREATWWSTDHTVWGEIADKESMDIVMGMYELPATKKGLTYLDKAVFIDISTP